MNSKLNQAQ